MKNIFLMSMAVIIGVFAVAYTVSAQNTDETQAVPADKKILVAYYSYSGNTKDVAQAIQKEVGGDLFEIKTEGSYPTEYQAMVRQVKQEILDGYRPKLTTSVENMAQYDIVFVGSPNWWGTITPQVSSFLETYDLSGKTVIPFITHGSGGEQNTIKDLTAQCTDCHVISDGWTNYGNSTEGLVDWLKKLGFNK